MEFAVALPILCMLLIATIQYGRMIWANMELTAAARDGARRAAVARQEPNPTSVVESVVRGSLDRTATSAVTVSVTGSWVQEGTINVRVTQPWDLNIMGVEVWDGQLVGDATVRIG